jgi:hypothetical protein
VYSCYSTAYSNYNCTAGRGTIQHTLDTVTNKFGFSNIGNISISSISPGYYNYMPCFLIAGKGSLYGSSILFPAATGAQFTFNGCFSSMYYVPLNLTAVITPFNETPIIINMTEVNLSQSTLRSEATGLPWPLSK